MYRAFLPLSLCAAFRDARADAMWKLASLGDSTRTLVDCSSSYIVGCMFCLSPRAVLTYVYTYALKRTSRDEEQYICSKRGVGMYD